MQLILKQTQSNFRFNFSGWFSPLAIDNRVFGRIMQNYVITSCLLSTGVSSAPLTILGMPDREKRWIERRNYFIREKAILSWICEVIDHFNVPLDKCGTIGIKLLRYALLQTRVHNCTRASFKH